MYREIVEVVMCGFILNLLIVIFSRIDGNFFWYYFLNMLKKERRKE